MRFAYEVVPLGNEADERDPAGGEVRLLSPSLPLSIFLNLFLCLIPVFVYPPVGQHIYSVYW
jgi:hypothetical protein